MPVKPISTLKTFFETGDRPTESHFADLIDSFIHKATGSVVTDKSYDEETGQVVINFNNGEDPLVFNIAKSKSEPISFIEGLQEALNNKVDKVQGKELSSNDYTNEEKTKLSNLENYVKPASEPISYIENLQAALDEKANDIDVVKSLTINNEQQLPDENGDINFETSKPYFLDVTPTFLNKYFLTEKIYGVFIDIPDTTDENFVFIHNLDIKRYFKVQLWLKQHVNGVQNNNPIIDLVEYILAVTASGSVDFQTNSLKINNFNLSDDYYIYVEYTQNPQTTEGVGSDPVGDEAIGIG